MTYQQQLAKILLGGMTDEKVVSRGARVIRGGLPTKRTKNKPLLFQNKTKKTTSTSSAFPLKKQAPKQISK